MADNKKSLHASQSLDIINEMIIRAKGTFRNRSFYFLLWGWIILAGSIGHYLLLQFSRVSHPEWAWCVVLIGVVASFWKGVRDRNKKGTVTYATRIYTAVWITFLVNYFIVLIFADKINFNIVPFILVITGSATYLSGVILKFSSLKFGALFIWVMSVLAFLVPLPYQLLATAAAVLVGYLIPGYMLKQSEA